MMTETSLRRSSGGFSLVEVTLALGVAAFCLVSLFGLVPIGVTSNQTTVAQTGAANVAASVVADLRGTPIVATGTPSPQYAIPVPASTTTTPQMHTIFFRDDGAPAVVAGTSAANSVDVNADPTQNPFYRMTETWTQPASGKRNATILRVLVTWPAMASPNWSATPANFSGSFETVTALDRN